MNISLLCGYAVLVLTVAMSIPLVRSRPTTLHQGVHNALCAVGVTGLGLANLLAANARDHGDETAWSSWHAWLIVLQSAVSLIVGCVVVSRLPYAPWKRDD